MFNNSGYFFLALLAAAAAAFWPKYLGRAAAWMPFARWFRSLPLT
jgi:hypothetical protein